MTIILNNTGNPITRAERIKINENWDRIIAGLTEMQYQINVLAGSEEVDKLLEAIQQATEGAVNAANKVEQAIGVLNETIQNANNATNAAKQALVHINKAIQDAESATQTAINKISELQKLMTKTEGLNEESQNKISEMLELLTTGNQLNTDLTNLKSQLEEIIPNALQATVNANEAYERVKGWGTAVEWNGLEIYSKNNVVTRNGSTFQSKADNNRNNPPTVTDTNWIMLAQRGVDGTGSVSSVNGQLPDPNGNVELDLGEGTVKSVNNQLPDGQGNVTINIPNATLIEEKQITDMAAYPDGVSVFTVANENVQNWLTLLNESAINKILVETSKTPSAGVVSQKIYGYSTLGNLDFVYSRFYRKGFGAKWLEPVKVYPIVTFSNIVLEDKVVDSNLFMSVTRTVNGIAGGLASKLKESVEGSGVYDILEVYSETKTSTQITRYKLTYTDGAVTKVERI